MKSKVTELGIFIVGVGIISAAFNGFTQSMLAEPGESLTPWQGVELFGPGACMLLVGIGLLVRRSVTAVGFTFGFVLFLGLTDAILTAGSVKWALSAAWVFAVVPTAIEAINELRPTSAAELQDR